MANSNRNGPNLETRNVQKEETPKLIDEKELEEWETFLDENFEKVVRKYESIQGKDAPVSVPVPAPAFLSAPVAASASAPDLENHEQIVKLFCPFDVEMILLDSFTKPVESSNYFYHADFKEEHQKTMKLLDVIFPDIFTPQNHYINFPKSVEQKNLENKLRREKLQEEMAGAFDLMWNSEFERLKKLAEKFAPEPFEIGDWKMAEAEELHKLYFGSSLQSIVTTLSTKTGSSSETMTTCDFDLQLQKEFTESSLNKIKSARTQIILSSDFIRVYAQNMNLELEKKGYFRSERDFILAHETQFLHRYTTGYFKTQAQDFDAAWNESDHHLKSIILDYKTKLWAKNLRKKDEIVEKLVDHASEKYQKIVHEAKCLFLRSDSTFTFDSDFCFGSVIFKESQRAAFHSIACSTVVQCLAKHPRFTSNWSSAKFREKLKEKLNQLKAEDLDKNQKKIDRMKIQQASVMTTAENAYEKLMKYFILSNPWEINQFGFGEKQQKLQNFHEKAMKWAQEFYQEKVEKLRKFYHYQGNGNGEEKTLIAKCLEIKRKLIIENEEIMFPEKRRQEEKQNPYINIDNEKIAENETGNESAIEEIRLRQNPDESELKLLVQELQSQLEKVQNELSFFREEYVKLKLQNYDFLTAERK